MRWKTSLIGGRGGRRSERRNNDIGNLAMLRVSRPITLISIVETDPAARGGQSRSLAKGTRRGRISA